MKPILAFLAVFLCIATSLGAAPRRPNVVLFLVDDLGWMDTSVYGSRYYETPNLERFAKKAMRFTDAYALPGCSPTRASILTGQHPSRHRITGAAGHRAPRGEDAPTYPVRGAPDRSMIYPESRRYLSPEVMTLARTLRQAGYRTGHIGKWHLGLMPQHWPDKFGFETAFHCAPDFEAPSYFSPYGVRSEGLPSERNRMGTITDGPDGEYITDRLIDEALKFIEKHREESFFLNLWLYGVHAPWGHKEEQTVRHAKKTDPRGEQRNPIMASMIESVDDNLGRVLERLDKLDLADDTIFIFYSDNGGNTHSNVLTDRRYQSTRPGHPRYQVFADWKKWVGSEPPTSNAPLRDGKGRIYEGGIRVPLLVRWPGHVEPGSTCQTVVGAIDLFPTILEAVGVTPPADHVVDGRSFLSVLTKAGAPFDREAYFTWFPHVVPAVSVRQGDWKLIRRFEPSEEYPGGFELFNLREDLGETTNLATKAPDKVRALDALIDGFIRDTGALLPRPNPAYRPKKAPDPRRLANLMQGLVPRFSKVALGNGALRVVADGDTPLLTTHQVVHDGPVAVRLRARSKAGGECRVQWRTNEQAKFPSIGQTAKALLPPGEEWKDLEIDLPVRGRLVHLRFYLPAQESPVEIESLAVLPANATRPIRAWRFR